MVEELKEFQEFAQKRGLKLTYPRRVIIETAFATHRHFSAEELLGRVKEKDKSVSKATLYRMLTLLKESRLLNEEDFGRGYKIYEHAFGHKHHDHLVCIKCFRIKEFKSEKIEHMQDMVIKREHFKPIAHSLRIYGVCNKCRRR